MPVAGEASSSKIEGDQMRIVEAPPNPSALIESMRDIGYSLGTALADLIDNSLTAGAETIRIFADTSGPALRVGIHDDGAGMNEASLLDAMRLGARSPLEERERSDLGRFGLGLKTASFSQCRVLTVVTKTGRSDVQREVGSGLRRRDQSVAGSAPGEPGRHPVGRGARTIGDARRLGEAGGR